MVGEKWTLDDAKSFAEEYNITLDITEEESDEEPGTVIYQNRQAGDPIISGVTLKIRVAIEKVEDDPLEDLIPGIDDNTNNNNNNTNNRNNNSNN